MQARRLTGLFLGFLLLLGTGAGCADSDETGRMGGTGAESGQTCSNDGQCAPPYPYCATAPGVCVECVGDPNCGFGQHCSSNGRCVECTGDGHCGFSQPYCDVARGQCVECLAPGNCTGTNVTCDTVSGNCVPACSSDGDCSPDFGAPYCGPGGWCVECLGDGNCTSGQPYCNTNTNQCVQCLSDGNCFASDPYCSPNNRCVECLTDAQCPGSFCQADRTCN